MPLQPDPPGAGTPLPPDPTAPNPVTGKENLSIPRAYVIATIRATSLSYGVPAYLTLATAYVESSFDPYALGDYVNGVATSFGLYMLHEGGELPKGRDRFWAERPVNNCSVAIPVIAKEWRKRNGRTPGQVAAAAQRPKDPAAYAAEVDHYVSIIRKQGVKALKSPAVFSPHNDQAPPKQADQGEAVPQGITGGGFTGASNWLLSHLGLPNIGVILRLVAGGVAVLVGLLILFHPNVSVSDVGKAAAFL